MESSILEQRRKHGPQPIAHPTGSVQGIPLGIPVAPPEEEDAEEGEVEVGEEEAEEDEQLYAHIDAFERGMWAPKIFITTRRSSREHDLPELGSYSINANKLWGRNHKGNVAKHSGLHATVWPLMLKHARLPEMLRKVYCFLWHEWEEALKGANRILYLDIFCPNGVHRSVGLAVMLKYLLGDIDGYEVTVTHMEQLSWPCFQGEACSQCTMSQVDLQEEYKSLTDLWELVQKW